LIGHAPGQLQLAPGLSSSRTVSVLSTDHLFELTWHRGGAVPQAATRLLALPHEEQDNEQRRAGHQGDALPWWEGHTFSGAGD
jgi:hypothetical protein